MRPLAVLPDPLAAERQRNRWRHADAGVAHNYRAPSCG